MESPILVIVGAYGIASVAIGIAAAVAIWVAAVTQSGIAIGGAIGLIPAWFVGLAVAAVWPLLLIVWLWRRDEVSDWIESQFDARG